jgi:hypothetical protein
MAYKRRFSPLSAFGIQAILLGFTGILFVSQARAQAGQSAPKPEPDVLLFVNGEKLIGHLERATDKTVTFKSDMAGEITVDWSKVKELQSSQKFAVVPKNVTLRMHRDTSNIPQGTVSMADQKLEVSPGEGQPPQTVPVADAAHVVDQPAFQKAVTENPGLFRDWNGSVTGGLSLVEATQNSRTFTGGFNLVRALPTQDWLTPRNRTTIDFTASYGEVTQPNTPSIKTEIYHADAERDEYLTSRVFAFGALAFDHNFSQGLDLQQTYGGGIGWTAIKTANEELDLKGSMNYIRQSFQDPTQNQNLVGSSFGENYNRKLPRGILFAQSLVFTPAWNNTSAYSALGSATLTIPAYKRLNLTVGVVDTFLNNPPPGFKKNSLQLTTGLTYLLR